jgi:phage regulator Rha-like protein
MSLKTTSPSITITLSVQIIERRIYLIRANKVMLDRDLAELYQVKTIALRQQVKRNQDRFPPDFMFQLSEEEAQILVSQNVIPSKQSLGGYLPYAFTQEGIAMLSSVLRSKKAVQVNIAIMRAFVKLREILYSNQELNRKFAAVIRKLATHDKYFKVVFDELEKLTTHPIPPRRQIGFKAGDRS